MGWLDSDQAEAAALRTVFGSRLPKIPICSFKAFVGNTGAGSGGMDICLLAKAVSEQIIPPSVNRAEPLPDTITRFEALIVPARMALPPVPVAEALSFTVAADDAAGFGPGTATTRAGAAPFDARHAIDDAMADYPRPFRRRAMLDTMLTFRLDGEEKTRSITMGGIAGAVWGVLPRR